MPEFFTTCLVAFLESLVLAPFESLVKQGCHPQAQYSRCNFCVPCNIKQRNPGNIKQDLTSKSDCIYTSLKDYQVATIVNKRDTDFGI